MPLAEAQLSYKGNIWEHIYVGYQHVHVIEEETKFFTLLSCIEVG
jgi:hypothetical protein